MAREEEGHRRILCGDPREEERVAAGTIGPGRRRGRPYIV